MSQTSHQFFEALESSMTISNLLTINGSKEDILFLLETQFFNGKKKINLKKLDLNTMSLRNHIYEDDQLNYEKITILCDEAEIKQEKDNQYKINVNFYAIKGLRQRFLEQISQSYPRIKFINSFFNIKNDYCGRAIFEHGTYQLIEHDLFSNRFGASFTGNFSLSTLFTDQLVYEVPINISRYENPFDFYQSPKLEFYIMRVCLESMDILNSLVNKNNNSMESQELLENLNYSSNNMIKKLLSTKFRLVNIDNDEEFSFNNYPVIDLSNFNNLLLFYKENLTLFNALYTSLLLEKIYLEKRKERIKKKKKKKQSE